MVLGVSLAQIIVTIVVLIFVAGAFAAVEASLARVSRARAAELVDEGVRGAKALATIEADPAQVLSVATFLRVTAESAAAVLLTATMLQELPEQWEGALGAGCIMAAASFVVIGVGPRTLGRQHAAAVGLAVAPLMLGFTRVLGPLARLLVLIGNIVTPGRGFKDGPFASEAELRELVDMAGDNRVIADDEREMIHSVFDFGDTITRSVMVPRTDLVAVEAGTSLRASMSLFLRSGFSRVPVIGDGVDDVLGMLYLKDVTRRLHERPGDGQTELVEAAMRPALFVPDSKPVDDLLRQMQAQAGHIAIVVDEYGGTAGLVTLEDLVEEIIGDIADEYDRDEAEVEALDDGVYRVRARAHIEDVGELFDLDLEDDDVDTVGGLLAKALGKVPLVGSTAEVAGLRLTAERLQGRRNQLATVVVERSVEQDGEADR